MENKNNSRNAQFSNIMLQKEARILLRAPESVEWSKDIR